MVEPARPTIGDNSLDTPRFSAMNCTIGRAVISSDVVGIVAEWALIEGGDVCEGR